MLATTQYIVLTEANFYTEVLNNQGLVLVDCWANWCGSSRPINPIYDKIAIAIGRHIKLARLNIAICEKLAALYGIRVVPTLLIFHQGELVERVVGSLSQADLANKLGSLLASESWSQS